ncbi:hypothetical protein LuPra_03947 [Luteitalea pratensis]|uniref:Uncharacterized protein n=1 Tax=Luteitalea pratensis TaxID=1855912 RepID=A0A143PRG2_LUTPR|nr:hypothetical protein [Luteitalea pratensis]AMY10708.1 hypothetical protein LuPra_03947 [Luteitalea pratensis]
MAVTQARVFMANQRAEACARLRSLGLDQRAIAKQLKISQATVCRVLARETARLQANTQASESHRAWQVARNDAVAVMAATEFSAMPSGSRNARLLSVMLDAHEVRAAGAA